MEPLTLLELNGRVKSTLQFELPDAYWVQAEISGVSPSGQGHCYMELVQKDPSGRTFLAKAKANVWRNTWLHIKPYFEQQTGETLKVGMKVLLQFTVTFHEVYGYSLNVQDIDPTYTLGDMARRRREILQQLEAPETGLQDAMKLYEEGVGLLGEAQKTLEGVEQQLKILSPEE